jgi:uncharacterized protein
MSTDHIRYDLLVQDALRSVVKNVIMDASKNGLPGEHHFYVSFKTGAPGVRISNRIREQYPEEMTIVLQHQFWDLNISEHTFEVGLSFGGVPERLLIPFDSIVGFFDPSVQFGLKFEVQDADAVAENDDNKGAKLSSVPMPSNAQHNGSVSPMISPKTAASAVAPPKAAGGVLHQQDKGKAPAKTAGKETSKPAAKKADAAITTKPRAKKSDAAETPVEQPTAAIVSLDAFRKKK